MKCAIGTRQTLCQPWIATANTRRANIQELSRLEAFRRVARQQRRIVLHGGKMTRQCPPLFMEGIGMGQQKLAKRDKYGLPTATRKPPWRAVFVGQHHTSQFLKPISQRNATCPAVLPYFWPISTSSGWLKKSYLPSANEPQAATVMPFACM